MTCKIQKILKYLKYFTQLKLHLILIPTHNPQNALKDIPQKVNMNILKLGVCDLNY